MRPLLRRLASRLSRATPDFRGKYRCTMAVDGLLRAGGAVHHIEHDGVRFAVAGDDLIEHRLLYHGAYQPELVRLLERLAGDGPGTFWDVGANVGSVVLPLLSRRPQLRAVAFEPSPAVLARLHTNVRLNPGVARRTHTMGIALGASTGPTDFYPSAEALNGGVGGMYVAENRVRTPLRVWCSTGDELIASGAAPAPTLLKVDVEGYEPEVLRGLEATLTKAQSVAVVFEHARYRFEERGRPLTAVVDFLEHSGLRVLVVDERGVLSPLRREHLELGGADFVAMKP